MQEVRLEKVVLNIGGTGDKLEKGFKLLEILSKRKPIKIKATKRIPNWKVRPGLEVGTKVTLRGEEAKKMLLKMLPAVNNVLKEKQVRDNFLSFGIHEYIEIPGVDYIRDVGIMGLEITAVFTKPGKRVERKKAKMGRANIKVSIKEIEEYMEKNFKTKILRREKT